MELSIPGPCGPLEAELEMPDGEPRAAAAMCHPSPAHGGTLRSTPVFRAARGLALARVAALRFNFRGVGRSAGEPDGEGGEEGDLAAALDFLAGRFPGRELWAGGFSFGAWTAANLALRDTRIRRLVLVALPVEAYAVEPLRELRVPGLSISASGDVFGDLALLRERLPEWAGVLELEEIEGADHFFQRRTAELQERVRQYANRVLEERA